jgi:TetR/AcrR family transcriptional regulator
MEMGMGTGRVQPREPISDKILAMKSDAPQKKVRGRPRKSGQVSGNQKAEIADVAMRLFSKDGFAATSMSEIARQAGLNQSSLYYWFPSKEAILRECLDQNRTSLRIAQRIGSSEGTAAVRLFAILYNDALMLCEFPFDYYDLEKVANQQPDSFAEFFDTYDELFAQVRQTIEHGIRDRVFRNTDIPEAALGALAVNEGFQHRYHHLKTALKSLGTAEAATRTRFDAHHISALAASTTLRALMPDPDIGSLFKLAQGYGWID